MDQTVKGLHEVIASVFAGKARIIRWTGCGDRLRPVRPTYGLTPAPDPVDSLRASVRYWAKSEGHGVRLRAA